LTGFSGVDGGPSGINHPALTVCGQYPGSQAPYAYYLAGLTTLTVATYGIQDPYDAAL
jgi:hypothetical protein